MTIARFAFGLLAAGSLLSACDSTESSTPEHNPDRVTFTVNGALLPNDTLVLDALATDTVRITFYQGADNLDDVESEHFSLLTFTPTLATATLDTAHHFTHTVVVSGSAGDTGHVEVGFGHDLLADENTFSLPVKVE